MQDHVIWNAESAAQFTDPLHHCHRAIDQVVDQNPGDAASPRKINKTVLPRTEVERVPTHDSQCRSMADSLRQQDVEAAVRLVGQVEIEIMATAAAPGMIENKDRLSPCLPGWKSSWLRLRDAGRRRALPWPFQMVPQGIGDLHADIVAAIEVRIEVR